MNNLHPRLLNEMHFMIGQYRSYLGMKECYCMPCLEREAERLRRKYNPKSASLMLTGNNAYIPDPPGETWITNGR